MLPAEFCVRRLPNPARRIDPGAGPIDSRPGTIDRLFRESPKQPEQKRLALRAGGKGTRVMQYCFRTVNRPSGPDVGQPATGEAPKSALRPAEGRPEGRFGFFSDSRLASLSLSLSLSLPLSLSPPCRPWKSGSSPYHSTWSLAEGNSELAFQKGVQALVIGLRSGSPSRRRDCGDGQPAFGGTQIGSPAGRRPAGRPIWVLFR